MRSVPESTTPDVRSGPFGLPNVGRTINHRLTLKRQLGSGGCAVVYLAEDNDLKREVAVKFSKPGFPDHRLRREAMVLERLRGASVPTPLGIGECDGTSYLVLSYHSGKTMRQIIRDQAAPMNPEQAARLVIEMCKPLAASHRQGIIHRDVKPDNVLVGDDGNVTVIDFGTALVLSAGEQAGDPADDCPVLRFRTDDGVIVGTCGFISPEQARGKGIDPVDGRADIYSLGCTLYYLLTNRVPFLGGDAESMTVPAVIRAHLTRGVENPRLVFPEIPSQLAKVVTRAGMLNPRDRYATVEELIRALRPFVGNQARNSFAARQHAAARPLADHECLTVVQAA